MTATSGPELRASSCILLLLPEEPEKPTPGPGRGFLTFPARPKVGLQENTTPTLFYLMHFSGFSISPSGHWATYGSLVLTSVSMICMDLEALSAHGDRLLCLEKYDTFIHSIENHQDVWIEKINRRHYLHLPSTLASVLNLCFAPGTCS